MSLLLMLGNINNPLTDMISIHKEMITRINNELNIPVINGDNLLNTLKLLARINENKMVQSINKKNKTRAGIPLRFDDEININFPEE